MNTDSKSTIDFDSLVSSPVKVTAQTSELILENVVLDIEVGCVDSILKCAENYVIARWTTEHFSAVVLCELGPRNYHTLVTFSQLVSEDEQCTCGVFVSACRRIHATKQVHITYTTGHKPIVVFSKSPSEQLPADALIKYGLLTLNAMMKFRGMHQEGVISRDSMVQNWNSAEGCELIEAMICFKEDDSQNRLPSKAIFSGRFANKLSESTRAFIEMSEDTYAIAKERSLQAYKKRRTLTDKEDSQ